VLDEVFEEGDVGFYAAHAEFAQRARHAVDGFVESQSRRDEFYEEGIEIGSDDGAAEGGATVEADAEAGGGTIGRQAAVIGDEMVLGVFGGDAALDGVAARFDFVLRGDVDRRLVKLMALRDEDLGLDDIESGDDFGDGVLDLDAGVDLDEIEFVAVEIKKEFDGAGVAISRGGAQAHGGLADAFADAARQVDAGGDFDDFLVAALDRAVALPEVDDVAVMVGDDLDFDVLGAADVALEENVGAAEGAAGFALAFFELGHELIGLVDDAHAAATAAEAGFDDQGKSDVLGGGADFGGVGEGFVGAGDGGDVGFVGEALGGGFVAEGFEEFWGGADEDNVVVDAGLGEVGVFGEEAVAGVDGVDAAGLGDVDKALDVEVAFDGFTAVKGSDLVGLIGLEAVE